ncbi:MAG: acyltransferase, partial [Acidobacteria bacterium]|nr:acyltransferase [Acidobacteriota bacterium]
MKQRNDIQGLRAVAVLLVILAHLEVPGFAGGWIGVDVFFVISGYLITSLLMREYDGTNHVSLLQFYVRRAKRILPAALTTIAVVVVAGYLLLNEIRAANIRTDALWSVGFVSNFRFISLSTDYFARSTAVSPLQHFWSLAVEEQFYLIWPALFLLIARQHGLRIGYREYRRAHRLLVVAGVLSFLSLGWSIYDSTVNPSSAYFSTATRVWELGFGVLLAVGLPLITTTEKVRRLCSWGGLAAILLGSCLIIKPGDPFPGYLALIPVLGAVGILLAGSTDKLPLPNRILATPPLVFIGTISFSLYLWHWPVHVFYDALHPDTVTTAAGIGIQAAIILALSLASYYLIENPTRHATWGVREPVYRRFDEIDLVPRGAATILCVGALLLFVVSSNVSSTRATDAANLDPAVVAENGDITDGSDVTRTIVQRDPQTVLTEWSTKVTDGVGVTKLPSDLQKTITNLSKQAVFEPCSSVAVGCVVNRPGATRTVAVFGDSHAAMLLSTIRAVFPNWN